MFTRVSLMDANPNKSPVALENEIQAGLHALDGEEQNHVEVKTGMRLQQRTPKEGEPGGPGEPGEGGGEGEVGAKPALTSLAPNEAVIGSTDFKLRLLGTDFQDGCTIVWNGGDEPTEFVSETELTTIVKPSTATVAVAVPVAVRNPDMQISNELPFTFTEPTEADLAARAAEQKKARDAKTREREKAEKDHERQEKDAAKHPEPHQKPPNRV